jgi:hypothetical protein
MSISLDTQPAAPHQLFSIDSEQETEEVSEELLAHATKLLNEALEGLNTPAPSSQIFTITLSDLEHPPKPELTSIRSLVGNTAVAVESAKYKEVDGYLDLKEKAIKDVEKIHDFLTAMKSCIDEKTSTIQMDKEPYRTYVDEMRTVFGDKFFPPDVYTWKGKEKIEGLRESLFNCIQDRMAHVNIYDMRVANILEQIKQMLESLRKIAEMEERSVEKTINKSSKQIG